MMKNIIKRVLLSTAVTLVLSTASFAAATIVIQNNDAAGVGFNDATPVAPVGGNPGTTLGQQRLNVFQAAANIWGATLTSSVTIVVRAQWVALTCNSTQAVLGSAGTLIIFRDFTGAPFPGSWYGHALSNKLFGADLDPATPDMNANFNVNLGQAGCLTGTFFYLGLDNNHGTNIDLETVLLHEFSHGLGFATFTSGTTGAFQSSFPSVYDRFMLDNTSGQMWNSMATNGQRQASAINTSKLVWNGPQVVADVPAALAGTPRFVINSPGGIAGINEDVGTATFGPIPSSPGVTADLLLANDGSGSPTLACNPLVGFTAGRIAVIDRGTCGFTVKVKNAQNAGAVGVIMVNNAAGSPAPGMGGTDATITIPSMMLTQAAGNSLKASMGSFTVNGSITANPALRAGADGFNKAKLYAPNPFEPGSSVSHFDTSLFANQLMEPAINGDLTHTVIAPTDLTYDQLQDIGWIPTNFSTSVAKTSGDAQIQQTSIPFPTAIQVTGTPAFSGQVVTWTIVPGTGNGTFAGGAKQATSTTDAAGIATAPPMGPTVAGNFTLAAAMPGAGSVVFSFVGTGAPTAAGVTVSGRVMTPEGRGLRGALVTLVGSDGQARVVSTTAMGFFSFEDVEVGQSYMIGVTSQRYTYQTQFVNVRDTLSGIDFIPE